jgi:hypothetical protein
MVAPPAKGLLRVIRGSRFGPDDNTDLFWRKCCDVCPRFLAGQSPGAIRQSAHDPLDDIDHRLCCDRHLHAGASGQSDGVSNWAQCWRWALGLQAKTALPQTKKAPHLRAGPL